MSNSVVICPKCRSLLELKVCVTGDESPKRPSQRTLADTGDLGDLLEQARALQNAGQLDEWQEGLVNKLYAQYGKYKDKTYVTEPQLEALRKITKLRE